MMGTSCLWVARWREGLEHRRCVFEAALDMFYLLFYVDDCDIHVNTCLFKLNVILFFILTCVSTIVR